MNNVTVDSIRVFESTDPKNLAVRYLIESHGLVIKMFDNEQGEFYSVKLWKGDIQRVLDHWNMTEVFESPSYDVVEDICAIIDDSAITINELASQERTN